MLNFLTHDPEIREVFRERLSHMISRLPNFHQLQMNRNLNNPSIPTDLQQSLTKVCSCTMSQPQGAPASPTQSRSKKNSVVSGE